MRSLKVIMFVFLVSFLQRPARGLAVLGIQENQKTLQSEKQFDVLIHSNEFITESAATNPSLQEISEYAKAISAAYKIPWVVLNAVMFQESSWRQFDQYGNPLISGDGGIGIMQVTFPLPHPAYGTKTLGRIIPGIQGSNQFSIFAESVQININRLKTDWKYNIQIGARILLAQKVAVQGAGDDAGLLENWWYPLAYYNGFVIGEANDPANTKYTRYVGNDNNNWCNVNVFPYQECIFNIIAQLYQLPSEYLPLFGQAIKGTLPGPNKVYSGSGHYYYVLGTFKGGDTFTFYGNNRAVINGMTYQNQYTIAHPVTIHSINQPVLKLPYPSGKAYRCVQEPGNNYTHDAPNTQHDLDFDTPNNSDETVIAALNGIAYTLPDGGSNSFGNHVNIDHGNGLFTVYAHLKTYLVTNGQRVSQGQPIGIEGTSGKSDGDHIHFGIHFGDPQQDVSNSLSVPIENIEAKDNTTNGNYQNFRGDQFTTGHIYESNNSATAGDGIIVKGTTPYIYFLKNNILHHLIDGTTYSQLIPLYGNYQIKNDAELEQYFKGSKIVSDGLICQQQNDNTIYLIQYNKKRSFTSETVYTNRGYKLNGGDPISPTVILLPVGILNNIQTNSSSITDFGKIVNGELYFTKNGQKTTTFAPGETINSHINLTAGDGYTVYNYVRLTWPDGIKKYAYYPDGQTSGSYLFSDDKRPLTTTNGIGKTFNIVPGNWNTNWIFNSYTLTNSSTKGQYTVEFWYEDINRPGAILFKDIKTYSIINPQVSVSPTSGPQGITLNQPGTGFTPNSTATLHFRKPDGTEYPTFQKNTDNNGSYPHSYESSTSNPTGTYQYWAIDDATGVQSNIFNFTITIATVIAVGEGAPNPQLFQDCYNRVGGSAVLGYPINTVYRQGNGYIQDFRKNNEESAIMKLDIKNEACAVYGVIWLKYKSLQGSSFLGYPLGNQEDKKSGFIRQSIYGKWQTFENGHIYWHAVGKFANCAYETHGLIDNFYTSTGGPTSWLGFPITNEFVNSKGYSESYFEDGFITTTDGITYQTYYSADLNCDFKVNTADFSFLSAYWNTDGSGANSYRSPDIQKDGKVNSADFAIMSQQWNDIIPSSNRLPKISDISNIEGDNLVTSYSLSQNYPNPFNSETQIDFSIPEPVWIEFKIFNLRGQLVKNLLNNEMQAGNHSIIWDGTDNELNKVAGGVYLYILKAGEFSVRKKMILAK